MIQNYRNRFKNKNSKLDFIYDILYNCQEPRTKRSVAALIGMRQNIFKELFDECILKGFIEKIEIDLSVPTTEKRTNFTYYKITKKGNDFIIMYDKMVVYIEKMNLILK